MKPITLIGIFFFIASVIQNNFSDIDEGEDLWIDRTIKAARYQPPKKILSILDGLDYEQEDKGLLVEDLRVTNCAMPNNNLKMDKRHPGVAYYRFKIYDFRISVFIALFKFQLLLTEVLLSSFTREMRCQKEEISHSKKICHWTCTISLDSPIKIACCVS